MDLFAAATIFVSTQFDHAFLLVSYEIVTASGVSYWKIKNQYDTSNGVEIELKIVVSLVMLSFHSFNL